MPCRCKNRTRCVPVKAIDLNIDATDLKFFWPPVCVQYSRIALLRSILKRVYHLLSKRPSLPSLITLLERFSEKLPGDHPEEWGERGGVAVCWKPLKRLLLPECVEAAKPDLEEWEGKFVQTFVCWGDWVWGNIGAVLVLKLWRVSENGH